MSESLRDLHSPNPNAKIEATTKVRTSVQTVFVPLHFLVQIKLRTSHETDGGKVVDSTRAPHHPTRGASARPSPVTPPAGVAAAASAATAAAAAIGAAAISAASAGVGRSRRGSDLSPQRAEEVGVFRDRIVSRCHRQGKLGVRSSSTAVCGGTTTRGTNGPRARGKKKRVFPFIFTIVEMLCMYQKHAFEVLFFIALAYSSGPLYVRGIPLTGQVSLETTNGNRYRFQSSVGSATGGLVFI